MYPIQIPVLGIGFEYLFERLSPQDNSQEHSCSTSLILTVVGIFVINDSKTPLLTRQSERD